MKPYTTGWGAIRLTDGERAFCPVTASCYAKTGQIFQVWQLYDAGRAIGWAEIKCFTIAVLADVALIPFRQRLLRKLVPELFADSRLEQGALHGRGAGRRARLLRQASS